MNPHIFADPNPDPASQNVANPKAPIQNTKTSTLSVYLNTTR